jgi:hypothetical protein
MADGMIGNLRQHGAEVEFQIESVELGRGNQGIHGGGTFSAGVRSREQEVLPSKSSSSERPLRGAVVDHRREGNCFSPLRQLSSCGFLQMRLPHLGLDTAPQPMGGMRALVRWNRLPSVVGGEQLLQNIEGRLNRTSRQSSCWYV